jgi:hypothetical protein
VDWHSTVFIAKGCCCAAAAVAEIEARPASDEAGLADCPSSATTPLAFLGVCCWYRFYDVRGPIVLLALWIDGNNLKIQSPNNLGDLALHITYIKYFANGVALWPDNPIHVFSSLRYPAGIDLFDSLLLLQHVDLIRALVWTGLLGSLATFYGFYRWGGAFGVAGFSFQRRPRRLRVLCKSFALPIIRRKRSPGRASR